MVQLFNRAGEAHQPTGRSSRDNPFRSFSTACGRCGGLGGSEAWRHTGFTCYDCAGSGRGPNRIEPLYTAEKLAKLNEAAYKRAAKKAAIRNAEVAAERERADAVVAKFISRNPDASRWVLEQAESNDFACSLKSHLLSKGELSQAQLDAVGSIIAKEMMNRASRHVGTEGERRVFSLTVERVYDFQISRFPLIVSYTNVCRDSEGNVVVYRGAKCWAAGAKVLIKATVKGHDEYKGVAQTLISRPKELEQQEAA